MKNFIKARIVPLFGIAALVAVIGFSMVACDGGDSTPTVTLTPASVTINDGNLTATVTVSGTATGAVSLNTGALPSGVTAAVSGTTITVTGERPVAENGSINNSYTVGVTREGVTQQLTVVVNLTTTFDPNAPITLTPASVTIDDGNLTATVTVGGTATGAVTLNTSALPSGVTAAVSGTTITVTGIRPTAEGGSIDDSFTVVVTREGVTQNLTVVVNLITTFDPTAPTVTLTPASVTIDDDTLTATVTVGGTATGDVTLNTSALPEEVTAAVSGTTITVTGARPATGTINDSYTVGVTREGVTQNLTVAVNLTTDPCANGHTYVEGECTECGELFPTEAGLYMGAPDTLTTNSARITDVDQNDLEAAVTYIKENSGEYTLLISESISLNSQQTITTEDGVIGLTIIGIGIERSVITAHSNIFYLYGYSTVITIGNNITLQCTHNYSTVVSVAGWSTFIMNDGSLITDTIGTAVSVDDTYSVFVMNGGTITKNTTGIYINRGRLEINGGSITGQTGEDIFVGYSVGSNFKLTGNTTIGTILLDGNTSNRPIINIGDWTGTVDTLYLTGPANYNLSNLRTYIWTSGRTVLSGTVNADIVSKFENVLLFASVGQQTAAISINASGQI